MQTHVLSMAADMNADDINNLRAGALLIAMKRTATQSSNGRFGQKRLKDNSAAVWREITDGSGYTPADLFPSHGPVVHGPQIAKYRKMLARTELDYVRVHDDRVKRWQGAMSITTRGKRVAEHLERLPWTQWPDISTLANL